MRASPESDALQQGIKMLNQTIDIGTDVATFLLFHPDDLKDHADDPIAWYSYPFAFQKEFAAGRMVAFSTGSDGGYRLRLTEGDLTEAEHKAAGASRTFGYVVQHGKVFVDNSDGLPGEEQMDNPDELPDRWITLPNGSYRVTVHAILRNDEATRELPDYVIRFERTEKLEPTPVYDQLPEVSPWAKPEEEESNNSSKKAEATPKPEEPPLEDSYFLQETPGEFLVPGYAASITLSDEAYEYLDADDGEFQFGVDDLYIILTPGSDTPTVGTLALLNGFSRMADEPGKASLRGERLVRITERIPGKPWVRAKVEAVERKSAPLSSEDLAALKKDFETYSEGSAYKKAVQNARFERDRVLALTSGPEVTDWMLQKLPLSAEQRNDLFLKSDTERAQALREFLTAKG